MVLSMNNPSYYKNHEFECWEEMCLVFGTEAVKIFCKLNVWKYRYRSGNKPNTNDAEKADTYLKHLQYLERKELSYNGNSET